jgi:D-3-phosphoglycerate dehydrogenase
LWNREPNRGRELAGLTVGVIGYGNTGSTFAKKLRRMEVRVLAYDKYVTGFGGKGVKEADLGQIQAEADVISLNVPLTGETHHLVDDEFLDRCSKAIVLINTSRGKVVDTGALARAVTSGKVAGAALDVLEEEPPQLGSLPDNDPLHVLVQNHTVIFTPHIAGWSVESKERIGQVLLEKIARIRP